MMLMRRTPLLAVFALGILPTAPWAQSDLVGIEFLSNHVLSIDVSNGVTTRIGTVSNVSDPIGGLARAVNGTYYGYTIGNTAQLVRLDPLNWSATVIGPFPGGFLFEGALAIAPTGAAWAVNGGNAGAPELWSIDLLTGSGTLVGVMGPGGHDINGLVWRPGGMLIGMDRTTNSIVEIDPVTAQLTVLAAIQSSVGAAGGAATSAGTTYAATGGDVGGISGSNLLSQLNMTTGATTVIASFTGDLGTAGFAAIAELGPSNVGTAYCTPNVNSTGVAASVTAFGTTSAASNNIELGAQALPQNSFGFFLTSQMQGFVPNPGGSQGNLCLGGAIGRYVGPGQIKNSGSSGGIALQIDLTQTPTPVGFVAVTAGETWSYQAWFRDAVGGSATSNFTDGVEVLYQ